MPKYICSKLASDNAYTAWNKAQKNGNDLPKVNRQVLVKGGSGVANDRIMTPYGVITEISDEDYKLVVDNCPGFNRHVKSGFLKVLDKNPSASDTKKIAADLKEDKSAPITPKTLRKEGKSEGKTGKTS